MTRGGGPGECSEVLMTSRPKEPNYCEDCEHHKFVRLVRGGFGTTSEPDRAKHICLACESEGPGGVLRVTDGVVAHDGKHVLECEYARQEMCRSVPADGHCPKFSEKTREEETAK